jgi:hypothetical protein
LRSMGDGTESKQKVNELAKILDKMFH